MLFDLYIQKDKNKTFCLQTPLNALLKLKLPKKIWNVYYNRSNDRNVVQTAPGKIFQNQDPFNLRQTSLFKQTFQVISDVFNN